MIQQDSSQADSSPPSTRRVIALWSAGVLASKVFYAAVLMLSAGRIDWLWGWVYVGIFLAFDIATAIAVIPRHPALLLERMRKGKDVKPWDQVIMRLAAGYLPMAGWIVAGLHDRFGWSPAIPVTAQVVAGVVVALGYALNVWAMWANAFYTPMVRLQAERGHAVASGGPYRFVRHPGYVGAILFTATLPVLLGSVWALIPAVLAAALFIVRTALEDRTLRAELPGYAEYAERTRYRLLPGVW